MDKQRSVIITVAVIGESGVGKTTFINALAAGEDAQTDMFSAEGMDLRKRNIRIGHHLVTLTFWDTTGNVRTGYLRNLDVKEVDGFILMYADSKWDTFAALVDSVDILETHLGEKPVLIVGNKFRGRTAGREVSRRNGEGLAEDLRANFSEVEALDDNQVREVVQNWTNEVLSIQRKSQRPLRTAVDGDKSLQKCSDIASSRSSISSISGQHRHFKVILVGNSKVGKTSFIKRLVTGKFQELSSSKEVDIVRHVMDVEGQLVKLQIWDTVAQERFHTLPHQYYRRAEGAIVMYDITSRESYNDASRWAEEIKKQKLIEPVLVVVGNKRDLSQTRQVQAKEGDKLAHSLSSPTMVASFFEASAKTGHSVLAAVNHMALQMLRAEDSEVEDVVHLQSQAEQRQKCRC
ncbi:ras and EF-hand domain-containing protein-like [Ornithodoros turicata]|uniref:ras and EF-hand domain-containing protein-like n=1 Tax=Ornithodoros turicata TaxID=34597 RepID=UPI003138CBF0